MQVVEAQHVLEAKRVVVDDAYVLIDLERGVGFESGLLQDVHLALGDRVDLGLGVAQRQVPLDPVNIDALAARGTRGRLLPRLVLRVLQVRGLVARLVLVAFEDVRA